jgi:hypothetical protein
MPGAITAAASSVGKIGQRTAARIKTQVEDLASAKRMRQSIEPRTAAGVADLDVMT